MNLFLCFVVLAFFCGEVFSSAKLKDKKIMRRPTRRPPKIVRPVIKRPPKIIKLATKRPKKIVRLVTKQPQENIRLATKNPRKNIRFKEEYMRYLNLAKDKHMFGIGRVAEFNHLGTNHYKTPPVSLSFSVLIKGPYGSCSGTLISEKHVLTAAHCMNPGGTCPSLQQLEVYPQNFTVFALGTCITTPTSSCFPSDIAQPFNVTEIHILDEFFEKCETADLAILTLSPGQTRLPHALFDPSRSKPKQGQFAVSGWGYDPVNPEYTGNRVSSEDVTAVKCLHPRYDHICTDGTDADTCEGDSGSGFFQEKTILGVTSSGEDCDTLYSMGLRRLKDPGTKTRLQKNGIFISVNHHMEFICQTIQKDDCKITSKSKTDEAFTFFGLD